MSWVHAVIDVPVELEDAAARFWSEALGWPAGRPWADHPELRSFQPPAGEAYIHLQRIDGPPRVHVDVEVDDVEADARRALGLGAEPADAQREWRTLHSPGGLPFCLIRSRPHQTPAPVQHADGHRSRMVQVAIDSRRSRHDTEVAFWRTLLRGRWVCSNSPEFAGKWHDDAGSPLQLLFQRRKDDDGPTRAHLDHGSDDRSAEVRRLIGLGAADLGLGHGGWHVLRDPAGLRFCVTRNSPESTPRRSLA
ncbi:MAG: hypothetical protein JO147_10310 [Actinobacteria bacterium]|nr:hypothetical protein [Actinomycetota bacterium]